MNTIIYEGFLSIGQAAGCPGESNYKDAMLLVDQSIAEELDWMTGKNVSVRYWVTDEKASLEQVQAAHMETVMGVVDAKFIHYYSEVTGYLYTTENLVIGGHNLLQELESFIGKYLILAIDYDG